MMECQKAIDLEICKADCCGIVRIPVKTIKEFGHLLPKNVELQPLGKFMFCNQKNSPSCGFLDQNYKCKIYDHRPKICKDYGTTLEMHCPHLNLSGKIMSEAKRKRWQRKINHTVDNTMKQLEKMVEKRKGDEPKK